MITDISSQLNAAQATGEQKVLQERQLVAVGDLEAVQREEKRKMEEQLDDEMHKNTQEIEEQIEQQKKLVNTRFPVNEVAVDLWSNTIAME